MKVLIAILLGWYLILRAAGNGVVLGPFDSKLECEDMADILVPLLKRFGVTVETMICMNKEAA